MLNERHQKEGKATYKCQTETLSNSEIIVEGFMYHISGMAFPMKSKMKLFTISLKSTYIHGMEQNVPAACVPSLK